MLWQIIKRFGDGKDLRSVGGLLSSIAHDASRNTLVESAKNPGLDPRLNEINLGGIAVTDQVPGAIVFKAHNEIHVRRI